MNEQEGARVLAEKVMGWVSQGSDYGDYRNPNNGDIWFLDEFYPQTNIEQAMMVVKALRQKQYFLNLSENAFAQTKPWVAKFLSIRDVNADVWGIGDTPAAAICEAALKAVGKED